MSREQWNEHKPPLLLVLLQPNQPSYLVIRFQWIRGIIRGTEVISMSSDNINRVFCESSSWILREPLNKRENKREPLFIHHFPHPPTSLTNSYKTRYHALLNTMPAKPLHLRHHQTPQHTAVPGLHRPSTPPGYPPASARRDESKLSFGTVCSSNINRSMEAHVVLSNAGKRGSAPVNKLSFVFSNPD